MLQVHTPSLVFTSFRLPIILAHTPPRSVSRAIYDVLSVLTKSELITLGHVHKI